MAAMAITSQGSMQRATQWDHLEDLEMGIWGILFWEVEFFFGLDIHKNVRYTGIQEFMGDGVMDI